MNTKHLGLKREIVNGERLSWRLRMWRLFDIQLLWTNWLWPRTSIATISPLRKAFKFHNHIIRNQRMKSSVGKLALPIKHYCQSCSTWAAPINFQWRLISGVSIVYQQYNIHNHIIGSVTKLTKCTACTSKLSMWANMRVVFHFISEKKKLYWSLPAHESSVIKPAGDPRASTSAP